MPSCPSLHTDRNCEVISAHCISEAQTGSLTGDPQSRQRRLARVVGVAGEARGASPPIWPSSLARLRLLAGHDHVQDLMLMAVIAGTGHSLSGCPVSVDLSQDY